MHLGKCYNHFLAETLSDTRPEVAALQRKLLRQIDAAQKLAMLGQMNLTVKTLALSGLRSHCPDDSVEMLRRRLADLILGPTLARRVYDPPMGKSVGSVCLPALEEDLALGKQSAEIGMPVEMVTRKLREDGNQRGMLVYGYKFRPVLASPQ